MISRRPLSSVLLSILLSAMAIPAAAQGIFDKPPIAGAAPDTPVPQTAPAVEKGPLDYTVSRELSEINQKKVLTELGAVYPDIVKDLEGHSLISMFAVALQDDGLRVDNLGDAFTVWLMINHGIVTKFEGEPTPAQVEGTKKLAHEAMLALPDLQNMSDIDKQNTAEALILQGAINQIMIDARKEYNPAGLPEAIEEVRNTAKQSGIDLDKFVMTQNGLEVLQ